MINNSSNKGNSQQVQREVWSSCQIAQSFVGTNFYSKVPEVLDMGQEHPQPPSEENPNINFTHPSHVHTHRVWKMYTLYSDRVLWIVVIFQHNGMFSDFLGMFGVRCFWFLKPNMWTEVSGVCACGSIFNCFCGIGQRYSNFFIVST